MKTRWSNAISLMKLKNCHNFWVFFKQTHGFSAYPVLPGSGKDSYVSILQVINVTANTTVTAIVDNGVGQMNRDLINKAICQFTFGKISLFFSG